MSLTKAIIHVTGLVQGVGFRPFVYRLATSLDLKGYVINLGDAGVEIVIEGRKDLIEEFLRRLNADKPGPARIDSTLVEWHEFSGEFKDFRILSSDFKVKRGGSTVPPDISICDECITDIMSDDPRWSKYAFTSCAVCGPRFTMILDIPYDRERTSMVKFPMCRYCRRDYENPMDRRYHAEGICCNFCGPKLELLDREGVKVPCSDQILEAAKLIKEGFIVAVKGIGGFHIACLATSDEVVLKLRRRRRRPQQPFAVMSPNIDAIKVFAHVSLIEEELLKSKERPIVVLKRKHNSPLSHWLSPGLDSIGVMLPYTGIHQLLLMYVKEPAIIMTSGNYPGEPMVTSIEDALVKLSGIVDFFLTHNRDIVNRCDDSVVRVSDGVPTFLRRSRGYAPSPVTFHGICDGDWCIVAFGGDFNVTVSYLKGNKCYVSQHIGDVDNLDTMNFLRQTHDTLMRLLKIGKIDALACDLNVTFPTTKFAEELSKLLDAPLIKVQHHHAHAASLAAEEGLGVDDWALYITIDGVGLGADGTAWGGEVLLASMNSYERVGHIKQYPLPGGDLCAYYPVRALAGLLSSVLGQDELEELLMRKYWHAFKYGAREVPVVMKQLRSGFNVIVSSSMGRFLDAISVMLGLCSHRTYEGEPAMKLEAHASACNEAIKIDIPIINQGKTSIVDASRITLELINLMDEYPSSKIAYTAHIAIARGLAEIACSKALEEGIKFVGVSGGAAVNEIIVKTIKEAVLSKGLKFLRHKALPPGDGGLSAGQALVGLAHINA